MRRLWCLLPILASGPSIPAGAPQLSTYSVVSAADYRGGGIAPGEIVVVYSSHAGPPLLAEWPTIFPRSADDLAYIKRQPGWDTIGSTRVFFDGMAAPVVYATAGQVEAIVPDAVSTRSETAVAIEYNGARSNAVKLPVVASVPALFTRDASGKGQAAMLNQTGCCNSPRDPAMPGSIATLFATGEGRPAQSTPPSWPVSVTVGSVPAEVLYANNVGMLVVNFRVPLNAPTGDSVPLALTVGESHSVNGVTMAIRPARRGVLIIGHDPMLASLAAILKRSNYEIVTTNAHTGDPPIDLVLADLATPLRAIEAVRATHAHVKLAIATGEATAPVLRSADVLGANAILTSSLSEEATLRRVANLLR